MMRIKLFLLIALVSLYSCTDNSEKKQSETRSDSFNEVKQDTGNDKVIETPKPDTTSNTQPPKLYSNARFKEVSITKTGTSIYRIKGKAQIFEANFNWVVEDGRNEIAKGHQMTDAGAPEWGNFDFIIEVKPKNPNSTLTLLLYETSAKDGSRQHELPIPMK